MEGDGTYDGLRRRFDSNNVRLPLARGQFILANIHKECTDCDQGGRESKNGGFP